MTANLPRHRLAIAAAFLVQGLLFISLTTRLPVLSQALDLSELSLAGLMLMMVLLAGVGSVGAERIARTASSARGLRAGLILLAVGTVVMGWSVRGSGSFAVFVTGLAIYGLGVGGVDAAANMQAVTLEHHVGRPVLPSFHGAWTLGGLLATVIALLTADAVGWVGAAALAMLPLAATAAPYFPRDAAIPDADTTRLGVPWRPIVMVGIGLILFYMVDTATTAWGPLYLASEKVFAAPAASASLYALATMPYLVATLLARLVGDAATARYGAATMIRGGAVLGAVGLAVVVFAPTWPVAVAGFFVVGLGMAVVAPLSFSAAARIAGGGADPAARQRRVDAVIARFNQFNYVGALLGSVLTGAIGSGNLRIGYAVPMVAVLGLVPLARHFGHRGRPA